MSNKLIKKQSSEEKNYGAELYIFCGKIFTGCGIASLLLMVFVSTLPQDYEKYNIPLYFTIWGIISIVLILFGIAVVMLVKNSKKFQLWAERDVLRYGQILMDKEKGLR